MSPIGSFPEGSNRKPGSSPASSTPHPPDQLPLSLFAALQLKGFGTEQKDEDFVWQDVTSPTNQSGLSVVARSDRGLFQPADIYTSKGSCIKRTLLPSGLDPQRVAAHKQHRKQLGKTDAG